MIRLETNYRPSPTFDDPLGMLGACHRRIEQALAMLEGVARREREAPLDEPAETALAQVLHYFSVGVPRHTQDEDESLFPRLAEHLPPEQQEAVARTEAEHAQLDTLHRELEVMGRELLGTLRFSDGARRERFGEIIAALGSIYREHIRLEDEVLFPAAARVLGAGEVTAIGVEMAGRRGIDWETHRDRLVELDNRPWVRGSLPSL